MLQGNLYFPAKNLNLALLLLFQSHPSNDKNCHFHTSFPGNQSLASLDAVISNAHSNDSHSLSLAVYKTMNQSPVGERVEVGREGRQHQVCDVTNSIKDQRVQAAFGPESTLIGD
jgi:hypothetical protein